MGDCFSLALAGWRTSGYLAQVLQRWQYRTHTLDTMPQTLIPAGMQWSRISFLRSTVLLVASKTWQNTDTHTFKKAQIQNLATSWHPCPKDMYCLSTPSHSPYSRHQQPQVKRELMIKPCSDGAKNSKFNAYFQEHWVISGYNWHIYTLLVQNSDYFH